MLLRGRERLLEEDAGLLEDVVAEANHMSNLASNLLTLARLDSGATHREHDVVNLAELSQQAAGRAQALAGQRGITVQLEHAKDLYVIGDTALLEVSDTGIGIDAEHLPHLGERFYRVDKARAREAGGTGLGLSIAQSIALAHGGTLRLSSIPEQGTTVTLTLPLAHATAADFLDNASGSMASQPERHA